jgi:hypothetical protein
LYPEAARGEPSPVSTQSIFTHCLFFSRKTVPIGFCCGGFSSTAGYVPGNEAQLARKLLERLLLFFLGGSLPKNVSRFYPANSRNDFSTFSSSKAFRLRFRA